MKYYERPLHPIHSIDDLPDYLSPKPLLIQVYEGNTKESSHGLKEYSRGALAIRIKHKPFVLKEDEED